MCLPAPYSVFFGTYATVYWVSQRCTERNNRNDLLLAIIGSFGVTARLNQVGQVLDVSFSLQDVIDGREEGKILLQALTFQEFVHLPRCERSLQFLAIQLLGFHLLNAKSALYAQPSTTLVSPTRTGCDQVGHATRLFGESARVDRLGE